MTGPRGMQLPTTRMIGFAWPPSVGVAREAVASGDHAARASTVVRVGTTHSLGRFLEGCETFVDHIVTERPDGKKGEDVHAQEGGAPSFGVYTPDLTARARSIEVRFATTTGLLSRLQAGRRYRNVAPNHFARR